MIPGFAMPLSAGLQRIGLPSRLERPTTASGTNCFRHFCLQEEGIDTIEALSPEAAQKFATLLCFVLVSPAGGHAFTSAYDFGPWPLLAGVVDLQPRVLEVRNYISLVMKRIMRGCSATLPCRSKASSVCTSTLTSCLRFSARIDCACLLLQPGVIQGAIAVLPNRGACANGMQVLHNTQALMLNGFVLDELPGPLVVAAARQTRTAGGSVFFDPGAGSRCLSMCICISCSTREHAFLPLPQQPSATCQRPCASHAATLQACAAQRS